MKTLAVLTILVYIHMSMEAKEIKYALADLPAELRENARSVIRNQEFIFEVSSISSATLKVTYAITVLNKNGLDDALFREYYDKFKKISSIRGRVFNENGEPIKRLSGDDIIDHSAISGSVYEDYRVKFIDPQIRTIPFTVEYSYECDFDGFAGYPGWNPQNNYNQSVEKSSYKAIVPKDMPFRYLEKNVSAKAAISTDAKNTTYFWEAKNLRAEEPEPYSYVVEEVSPYVLTAPSDFELDSYKGNMTSWETMGKWVSELNECKNNVNEDTKKAIQTLVSGIDNEYDKVRRIYEYMQNKTRFVSVKVGIGGLQPFDAATVDRVSYGDCKALTNYTKTLLEAAGIKSNYCLVNSGEYASPLVKDFPSMQFDHVFLCVPMKQDTLWLECTNTRFPCGYIGDFTDDRDILLIDKDQSKIVHTKIYGVNQNRMIRTSQVTFENGGNGKAEICTCYHGLKYSEALAVMLSDDADKKRILAANLSLPTFNVLNYSFTEHKNIIPSIDQKVKIDFQNYGTALGSRMFIPLNFVNRLTSIPSRVRSRKTKVYIKRPSLEMDTVKYDLPIGYKLESLPKQIDIQTVYGEYHARAEAKNKQVLYIRSFQVNKGLYPPSAYPDFVDFFDKVSTADGMQCSLVRE